MRKIIILLILLVSCLSLKQTEIHRNDWQLQNIGEVLFAHQFQNKLFYLTHQNVLGHLRLDNGQIQSRITLSEHDRLLNANQREVIFITDNNQIVSYKVHNLERQVNNKFLNDKIIKSIKSYINIQGTNKVILNDQKNVRIYSRDQDQKADKVDEVYTAQPNQLIQTIFYFGDKLYFSILRDQTVIFKQVANNQLAAQQLIIKDLQISQGWQIAQTFAQQEHLVVLLVNQQSNTYYTSILNESFQSIYQIPKKYNQIIKNQILFCSKSFDLSAEKQTKRIHFFKDSVLNIDYALEDEKQKIKIFKSNSDYSSIQKSSPELKIKHIFAFQKSSFGFYILIQYCDMTLELHTIQNGNEKKLWTREEGLAFIEKVLFMKYPYSDHLDNEYHRSLLSEDYTQMSLIEKLVHTPSNIALRVKQQIADLIELVISTSQSLLDFSQLSSFNLNDFAKFTMSEYQELKLGLKKYIIAITKKGTIYSIDTKTNKVLWKINRTMQNQQIVSLLDLRKDYELQAAVLATYNLVEKLLIFEEIKQNGQIVLLDKIQCDSLPSIHKLNHESIIINVGDKTLRYQLGESHAHEKNFYFYTQQENKITGWKQMDKSIVQIWNLNLDQGEKIVSTASAYRGQQRSHIPLFDNGKVIFKNIDFTNLAVLTSKNATSMSLYILNGMTGQVHFNQYRSGLNLNHPVNLVYDENNVIVTYYNNRNKLYEIWTVEEYQQKIENSAISMIKEYLEGVEYKPSRNRQNIIFLSQVYGAPVAIKKMFISESKQSLIRRNLIVITRDDKIYVIGRELVSTRRPKESAFFTNEAYPPYQYLIPFEPIKYFSYNLKLHGLNQVYFSPTDMQSTIFILAYGTDVFMIRVAPDNPFDTITEDFNYLVLVAIVIAVSIGVLVLRAKAKNAKLIKPHRD